MGRYASREVLPAQMQRSTRTPDTATHTMPQADRGSIHDLQRLLGNQGVQRLLAANPTLAQAKLTVGAANDAYEQEADRVASEVMTMQAPSATGGVQREAAPEEEEMVQGKRDLQRAQEEDELAMKRDPDVVQRAQEEDELAMKRQPEIVQRAAFGEEDEMAAKRIQREATDMMGSFDVTGDLENQIGSMKGGGNSLDSGDQQFFQDRMGHDFSNVRVHTDSASDAVNRSIGAQAFTNGSDVFMSAGKYNPGSSDSRELLAHELTHVVQQTGGSPVQPKRDSDCENC